MDGELLASLRLSSEDRGKHVSSYVSSCSCLPLWFIRMRSGRVSDLKNVSPCEDETQEMCSSVKGERSSTLLFLASSPPGPPEAGESVSEEGMAGERDGRRRSR